MHHVRAAYEIRTMGVSKQLIAALAGIHRQDFVGWTNGKDDLSPEKVERIATVINRLKLGLHVYAERFPGIPPDLKNVAFAKRLVELVAQAEESEAREKIAEAQAQLQQAESEVATALKELAAPLKNSFSLCTSFSLGPKPSQVLPQGFPPANSEPATRF